MLSDSELAVELLAQALNSQSIELSETTKAAFQTYAAMLVDWNSTRFNLTRLVSPQQIALNHFLDSLAVTKFVKIPFGARVIDIGTGAGFPGLALKIYRPDVHLVLIESTAKKLLFCRAVGEELGLTDIEYLHGRAEDRQTLQLLGGSGAIVTARAVAPLKQLLTLTAPLLSPQGAFIAWKGSRASDEMLEAEPIANKVNLRMDLVEQVLTVADVEPVKHYYVVCRRRK
jgi:16S rRNA (guanine527-N7)-methyltransferase